MPKATQKSNSVSDTYANEGQEELNIIQEALSENELQEDYTDHKNQVQMIQKYFSTPNLTQVIKSKRYQT